MSLMTWTNELNEQERAELETAQTKRDAARVEYNEIYRKLKIRCDARIRREKERQSKKAAH